MGTSDGNESSLLSDLAGLQDPRFTASFLEVAFDAVVAFDPQERVTSWNPAARAMFGWTAQEALGKTPGELFWPADALLNHEDKKQRQARLMRGETLQGELFPCRKDGTYFPAQFTARAILDPDGKASGYLAVYRDLSDRMQAREKEEQLQQSNQRLNQILASIQDDFYVLNRDWMFVFASRTFTSRIGKEPEDFVGRNIWEMFPSHIGGVLYENFHIAMEKREIRRFEIPGKYTGAWYRMNAFPSEEGITVIGTDITERKKAEAALRESEERYRSIVEGTHEGVWILDLKGVTTYVNAQMAALLGYAPEEMIGRSAFEFVIPDDITRGEEEWKHRRNEMGGRQSEYRYRHKDGHAVWFLVNSNPLVDGQGKSLGILGMFTDINKRRQAEDALRENQAVLQSFYDSAPFLMGITEVDGDRSVLVSGNQALAEFFASQPDNMMGLESSELGTPVEIERMWVEKYRQSHAQGAPVRFEHEYPEPGSGRWFQSTVSFIEIGPSGKSRFSFVTEDITGRKQAETALLEKEKQLQQLNDSLEQQVQEKTAEVRRLAADLVIAVQRERHRISHILHDDLQQRIYAIQMQLTFLGNELNKVNEAAQNEALDIEKQLDEVLEITRNLSIDLSPPILQDEGLTQAISWLAGQMKQRYGLQIEVQADGSFIVPDEELQVLLFNCIRELLFNVVKHAEASRAVVELQWLNDSLQIDVYDDGRGFHVQMEDQQSAEEISEEENLQVSFGLPTLRYQLILFGGHMEIKSEPGAGACVTIIVPIAKTT